MNAPMKTELLEQGTDAWLQARLGRPTASEFSKLIGAQGKPSTQAAGYINRLIAERITGELPKIHETEAMRRGTELEPRARSFYEFIEDMDVTEVGLVLHPELECGASPDGLLSDGEGILEIKCPMGSTMVEYLRGGKLPSKYKPQVMGQLWITNRAYCHFLAYHPKMDHLLVRVERDEAYIELLAEQVAKACETIKKETEKWSMNHG